MDQTEDEEVQRTIQRVTLPLVSALLMATSTQLHYYIREEYHTSILTGEGWVQELLAGHAKRIHCELGVSREGFHKLISYLRSAGYKRSRHLSLEEQLSIFLYTCVTGLTTRHVGERFQRSSETISR